MSNITEITSCPFCEHIEENHLQSSDLAFALLDHFPVSKGHTLIIPKRHEPSFLSLTMDEQKAMFELSTKIANELLSQEDVDGCNIGMNIGVSAGQTVLHAHLHIIPRCTGDTDDPRGGIRWVLPNKAKYWA